MSDAIDIWTLPEAEIGTDVEDVLRNSLSTSEREKAQRYRREEDRRRSVAARGLLRHALSERVVAVAPAAWSIEVSENGRPLVRAPHPLSVSVTHTPGLVAVAVTASVDVGVDAEFVDRRVNFDQVTRRWYSPVEIEELAGLVDDQTRRRTFFRYWVLKEAYSKALGLGLAIGLDRVRFEVVGGRLVVLEDEQQLDGWSFEVREAPGGLLIGVAAATSSLELRWRSYAAR